MTSNDKHEPGVSLGDALLDEEQVPPSGDALPLKALLKRSLDVPVSDAPILPEVQEKLRVRSQGKFYNTRWSTSAGRSTYALIGVSLLVLAALAYGLATIGK
jgi:hypothetical protein